MKKQFFSFLLAFVFLFTLTACDSKISNKSLQKMIQENNLFENLDISTVKVIDEAEIEKNSKIILFSAKLFNSSTLSHFITFADTQKDILSPIEFAYPPMQYLNDEVTLNRHQELNEKYFLKMAEYAARDKDLFSDADKAAEFLREITSKGGILATATSQKAIEDFAKEDFELSEAEEFFGIFEDDTANPICYAASTTESLYSWDWLPESQYLSFVSNNRDELEEAEVQYGPAYKDVQAWTSFDLYGNKQKVYESKAQLYEDVTGKEADFDDGNAKTDGVLRFVTVSDKKPFAYIENGDLTGADIEIAKKLADELNMKIEISTASSSSAIKGTGNGNFDMAMAGFTTEGTGKNITFTDNYYKNYVIILGKDNTEFNERVCVALARIKNSGDIDTIAEKYNLESVAEKPRQYEPSSPAVQEEEPSQSAEEEKPVISYRVRKAADDSSSQAGAFASIENAKKEADTRKDEGYKVYDMQGNLIYTP